MNILHRLNIKASKTDPFRQGVVINISANTSNLCPIRALISYLQVRTHIPGPLFRFHNGKFLTRADIDMVLRDSTKNEINVSSHSIRIGAASTAAMMGCPKWLIQFMGRWSSDCYRNYIRVHPTMIQKTSRALSRCNADTIPTFHPQFLISNTEH